MNVPLADVSEGRGHLEPEPTKLLAVFVTVDD